MHRDKKNKQKKNVKTAEMTNTIYINNQYYMYISASVGSVTNAKRQRKQQFQYIFLISLFFYCVYLCSYHSRIWKHWIPIVVVFAWRMANRWQRLMRYVLFITYIMYHYYYYYVV